MNREYKAIPAELIESAISALPNSPLRNALINASEKEDLDTGALSTERLAISANHVGGLVDLVENLREFVDSFDGFGVKSAANHLTKVAEATKKALNENFKPRRAGPFVLGNWYETKGGEWVKLVGVSNPGTEHESVYDQHGFHRYTRWGMDCGRVTGSKPSKNDLKPVLPGYVESYPRKAGIPYPSILSFKVNGRHVPPIIGASETTYKQMIPGGCLEDTYDDGTLLASYSESDLSHLINNTRRLNVLLENISVMNINGEPAFAINPKSDIPVRPHHMTGSLVEHLVTRIDQIISEEQRKQTQDQPDEENEA